MHILCSNMANYKKLISKCVEYAFEEYGLVIGLIFIGFLFGWYAKLLLADRKYKQQIELRLSEKETQINDLKVIVSERLRKIKVEQHDKSFFSRIKKYFKEITKKN